MRPPRPLSRAAAVTAGATALTAAALFLPPVTAAAAPPVGPRPAVTGHRLVSGAGSPLTIAQCQDKWGINCYTPQQYRQAYDLDPLYRAGITGKGRTIVIVDSYGSPTIQHDLDVYSAQFGIPSTQVQIVRWGDVPPFDATDPDQSGWAGESSLDVEMAHAVAPDAHLVLVETGVAETEGVTGLPEMMDAEKSLIDRGIGDVISQSFGATENTFPGFEHGDFAALQQLRYAFEDAARHGVTVLGSSGDSGATDAIADGSVNYPYAVNSWPSADPLVVSVGGTQLHLDEAGNRTAPDSVYHDYGASGGGTSQVFARPSYQNGVKNVVGERRGTPDISMSAAVDGGAWVYSSYDPREVGWNVYGGTSESSPLFSGVVALADQLAGRRLGDLHEALYALAADDSRYTGIVDVADGTDNTYDGVPGYTAVKGYDMATGVGTLDATRFAHALAAGGWRH